MNFPLKSGLWVVFACGIVTSCAAPGSSSREPQEPTPFNKLSGARTKDLRTFFQSEDMIRNLENRGACSIEPKGAVSKRVELPVGRGVSLDVVIRSLYGGAYDGQIKVVSRDSILQTPIVEYAPESQRNIIVHPGDLVFIQGRD